MFFIKLDTLETVNKLANLCSKYQDYTDVDITHGRYVINGSSVLAVTSLLGNIVKVVPTNEDKLFQTFFLGELKAIGGWEDKTV